LNNKKTSRDAQFMRISRQLLLRLLLAIFLYSMLGLIVYVLAIFIFGSFTWYGDELFYPILHWLNLRKDLFGLAYIIIGYCVIFVYYWRKPFRYLSEIVDATRNIFEHDDSLIELSTPLSVIESQMNQIKITTTNNERSAREAEQRKNDLVAYLAHDLKTPITSLIGYLTLLKDESQISKELQERYLSISLDKAGHLDDLINEFFEITRFNLSHITLEYERVNLTRMLEQLSYEFKPMFTEKNLKCLLSAPPDIMIRCDGNKLQRALDNLLRNAVNYGFENTSIRITAASFQNYVQLSFENSGNTISEEKLDRLFEQFYRLDSSRSSKSGGSGLGLAIAKEIIEAHRGNISAFSEDEIIRLDITLPLS